MSIKCQNCGNTNDDKDVKCKNCGKILVDKSKINNNKVSKVVKSKESAQEIDHKLQDKYREKMHGDGGTGFNSFVDQGKKKKSSKMIRLVVSLVIIAILAVTGKEVYDHIKNRDFIIRNVKIGMTKEEVKNAEKEGKQNIVSDDVIVYEGVTYAGIKGDAFYNFRDDSLYFIQIKMPYNENDIDKVKKEMKSTYGSMTGKSDDETKIVWEIKDNLNAYFVASKDNNIIEVDICEPNTNLDKEIIK